MSWRARCKALAQEGPMALLRAQKTTTLAELAVVIQVPVRKRRVRRVERIARRGRGSHCEAAV
jgi:hypothetical protein